MSPTAGTGGPNGGSRPLRPFAGMTRIRFKGFGVSPSQPHLGTPLEHTANLDPAPRSVNTLSKTYDLCRLRARSRSAATCVSFTPPAAAARPSPKRTPRSKSPRASLPLEASPAVATRSKAGRPPVCALASGETRRKVREARDAFCRRGGAAAPLAEDLGGGLFVRGDDLVGIVMKRHHLVVSPGEPRQGHEPVLGQIENRRDEPDREKLEHDPGDRSGDDVAHRDRDRGHHKERLDNQKRHQEYQEHKRRRQPVDERRQRHA